MAQKYGYVYVRDNELCRLNEIYKVGITSSIPNRHDAYLTYEYEPGFFLCVLEVALDQLLSIDMLLKDWLEPFHRYVKGGGTEYYIRSVVPQIANGLRNHNISFRELTREEIDAMQRKHYDTCTSLNIQAISLETTTKKVLSDTIVPSPHQQEVLDRIEDFYTKHHVGKLIWACGLGKALLGLLIAQKLECSTVLIGVPSNQLQKQMAKEIARVFPSSDNIVFVGGENGVNTKEVLDFLSSSTNPEQQRKIPRIVKSPKFVVSTYHSCHLLVHENICFDFKIGDEVHHLVGVCVDEERIRGFRLFHKIVANKTLFMTATAKTMQTSSTSLSLYSMDDETVFGTLIDVKSVHWAIENRKITDYHIVVLKNTEDDVDRVIRSLRINVGNKELFLSCYMCIASFEKYHGKLSHLLLYTNTIEDAVLAQSYIDSILEFSVFSIPREQVYNRALYSNLSSLDMEAEVTLFKSFPYGIIPCVYIFGEGFDLPKLNGVCIAGNMRSETRIVQYLLRPNRLDPSNPSKIAYIIIPYMDTGNDWDANNRSFDKVRNVVAQMRNVDEQIEQKLVISIGRQREKGEEAREQRQQESVEFDDDDEEEELKQIKLRLRYSKALRSKNTEEQDEYNYVQSFNRTLRIQSKKEYYYAGERRLHGHYIEDPEEYFKSKGVWKNWYDFMGMDTAKLLPSKTEWISFCREKHICSIDEYNRACELHDVLPKEPALFYKDFSNITAELTVYLSRR